MIAATGLIPRARLKKIPSTYRLAHEYCFFLHDQCVAVFKEYESAHAHNVRVSFQNEFEIMRFSEIAKTDALEALRVVGHGNAARRIAINMIVMGMVSDTLHHIFEALSCFEKRKFIVGFGLLRKPLMDSLLHLSWILGDEDGFYEAFSTGDPVFLTPKRMGARRGAIIADAISKTRIGSIIDAEFVRATIFDRRNPHGLQKAFQHAVHLVTVDYEELRTDPESFNFIFKNPEEDDLYDGIYENLPPLLFYLAHVILELFDRMRPMDPGAKTAFLMRSQFALFLLNDGEVEMDARGRFERAFGATTQCPDCKIPFRFTPHNAARILLRESIRCTRCRQIHGFPFSWLF